MSCSTPLARKGTEGQSPQPQATLEQRQWVPKPGDEGLVNTGHIGLAVNNGYAPPNKSDTWEKPKHPHNTEKLNRLEIHSYCHLLKTSPPPESALDKDLPLGGRRGGGQLKGLVVED